MLVPQSQHERLPEVKIKVKRKRFGKDFGLKTGKEDQEQTWVKERDNVGALPIKAMACIRMFGWSGIALAVIAAALKTAIIHFSLPSRQVFLGLSLDEGQCSMQACRCSGSAPRAHRNFSPFEKRRPISGLSLWKLTAANDLSTILKSIKSGVTIFQTSVHQLSAPPLLLYLKTFHHTSITAPCSLLAKVQLCRRPTALTAGRLDADSTECLISFRDTIFVRQLQRYLHLMILRSHFTSAGRACNCSTEMKDGKGESSRDEMGVHVELRNPSPR